MSQAQILVVDDEPDIRELVCEILEDEGYGVISAENGETARSAYAQHRPDLVLLDIWMPDVDGISLLKEWTAGSDHHSQVVMMSGHGTVETAVEATRLGAYDFVQKPLSLAKLLATVRKALDAVTKDAHQDTGKDQYGMEPLGNSAAMQLLRQQAEQAAKHLSPVLICGESGSGKETLARYIHRLSGRDGAFVMLDHALLEGDHSRSYLLGEAEGESGVLEQASGGTLFVPEIQNLDEQVQQLLQAVLEAGAYIPECGTELHGLNTRVIASACVDIDSMVRDGRILDQLYFRLNVLPLKMPALRDRPEDVPELVRFFAEWFPNNQNLPYRSFSVAAQNRLRNHSWPGNIRELRNMVQRLLILGGSDEVAIGEVETALQQNMVELPEGEPSGYAAMFDMPLREAREQFERKYLEYQLQKVSGSVGKLAEVVGMERTHLYRKLRTLGIDPKKVAREGGGA